MPGRRSKYNATTNSELEFRVISVLNDSKKALTIAQIQREDPYLAPFTSQKLTRVLTTLIEMGLVRKGKSKTLNRMLYKSVSVMLEEGYDVTDEVVD